MTTPVMLRRNRGLLRAYTLDVPDDTGSSLRPGDPAYSPNDAVTQSPIQYLQRSEAPTQQEGPEQSQGWWPSITNQIHPSQYINQNVGGERGDTKRLGWSMGLHPFTYYRQPFTGAVLNPPHKTASLWNVGEVGRLGQRDTLAARVAAAFTDFSPDPLQTINATVNPVLGG